MPYTRQSQVSSLHLLVESATVEGDTIVCRLPETTQHVSPDRLNELIQAAREGLESMHQALAMARLR